MLCRKVGLRCFFKNFEVILGGYFVINRYGIRMGNFERKEGRERE